MTDILRDALILMTLLQVKHMFADFFMQTPRMLAGRDAYAHLGRAQHAAIHAAGSVIAYLVVGSPLMVLIWIVLAEWVAHYHIDWAKGRYSDSVGHTPADPGYWRAFGFDQLLHQLTYVAMVWAWLAFGASG